MKKNCYTCALLLCINFAFSQTSNWAIGLSMSGSVQKGNYTLTDWINEDVAKAFGQGYGLKVDVARSWNKRWALQSGLQISRVSFHPGMRLPGVYGTRFQFQGKTTTLLVPYLAENNFDLLQIPIGFQFLISPNRKWQFSTNLAVNSSIKWNETEIYKGLGMGTGNNEQRFAAFATGLNLFGIGLDWGCSIAYPINPQWSIRFYPSIRLLEYRAANEKFKRNGEFLHGQEWLSLSQASLSLGIQRQF